MTQLKDLRIAFLAGTLGQGGAERQLFYILKALKESGADPHVLCLTQGEFWEEKIQALGVPVAWVGRSPLRFIRLAQIIRELRRRAVDIVQSQHSFTNLYAVASARVLGLQEIGAIRNDAISVVRANGRLVGRLSLRAPRVLAVNAQSGMRTAVALGASAKSLIFLPNVVDTECFRPWARSSNRGYVRLLAVGRLVRQKRMDRFVRILATLRPKAKVPVSALVIGEGPLRPALEQQAKGLGLLPDGIEFRGRVSDMRPVYQEADILVLTSDYEGTPNVVLEAMASGLPVVATGVGGVPDIIQHGKNGFLVDRNDEEGAARAILRLINDRHLRRQLGICGRRAVEQNHSLDKLRELLAKLYGSLLC